ncbi:MAG: hypothetical protein NVV63_13210 [Opitutus sp.]|nr:hypothetical protein [Opitutus sp.]
MRIEVMERLWSESPEMPAELVWARAQLAAMELRYLDNHPRLRTQRSRVEALEAELARAPDAPRDLWLARARVRELGDRYGENNPKLIEAQMRLASLENQATAVLSEN